MHFCNSWRVLSGLFLPLQARHPPMSTIALNVGNFYQQFFVFRVVFVQLGKFGVESGDFLFFKLSLIACEQLGGFLFEVGGLRMLVVTIKN